MQKFKGDEHSAREIKGWLGIKYIEQKKACQKGNEIQEFMNKHII